MFLIKLLSSAFFVLTVNGQCRSSDHSVILDLCYIFPSQSLNFQAARDFCHGISSNLAVVHGSTQANFLTTKIRTKPASTLSFWIGLSRPAVGAAYQWDDGTQISWSNFDSSFSQNQLCVAESTINTKWRTLDCQETLSFVCSYDPRATSTIQTTTLLPPGTTTTYPRTTRYTPPGTTTTYPRTTRYTPPGTTTTYPRTTRYTPPGTTTTYSPAPALTCLMMFDTESSGISSKAVAIYQTYFDFAKRIGNKLANSTIFTGYIDNFGYSGLEDHEIYPTLRIDDIDSIPMPVDTDSDDIDLHLKCVDESLRRAIWVPPVADRTCLVFISAAAEDAFGGTTIRSSYTSFGTVVGVLVGDARSIPGLSNVVAASALTDEDAQAVVDLIFENLPPFSRNKQ